MKHIDPVERLRSFFEERPERTQTWLADLLHISQAAVSQWLLDDAAKRTRPAERLRAPIAQITGIPAEAWDTDEERADRKQRDQAIRAALRTGTEGR